jgi:GNAT superfamily N-acetyltransferase
MDIQKIEIRRAELEDAPDILTLCRQLGYQASANEITTRLENITQLTDHCVFVAYHKSDEISGWIHVFSTFRVESAPFSEIGGLVVDELHRNQGIGTKLVHAALQWTIDKGFRSLRVRSRVERESAKKFYLNTGFSLIKEQCIFEKELP